MQGPPGLHTTTRELQTRTLKGSGASNTTKIPREDTQRDTKRAKWWRKREKKREILGPPPFGAPPFGSPPFGAPFFKRVLVLPCFFVVLSFFEKQENTETVKLAKVGLAKVGHSNFGQSRSIKVGQSRSYFFGQSRFGLSRSQPPREIIQYLRRTSHIHYQVFGRQSTSVNDDEIEFVD